MENSTELVVNGSLAILQSGELSENLDRVEERMQLEKIPTPFPISQAICELKEGLVQTCPYPRPPRRPQPYNSSISGRKPSLQTAPVGFDLFCLQRCRCLI